MQYHTLQHAVTLFLTWIAWHGMAWHVWRFCDMVKVAGLSTSWHTLRTLFSVWQVVISQCNRSFSCFWLGWSRYCHGRFCEGSISEWSYTTSPPPLLPLKVHHPNMWKMSTTYDSMGIFFPFSHNGEECWEMVAHQDKVHSDPSFGGYDWVLISPHRVFHHQPVLVHLSSLFALCTQSFTNAVSHFLGDLWKREKKRWWMDG